jgi:hypothetical protein
MQNGDNTPISDEALRMEKIKNKLIQIPTLELSDSSKITDS